MNSEDPRINRRELLAAACGGLAAPGLGGAGASARTYVVVAPGTHPGILFSEAELPALRRRARGTGMAAEAYRMVRANAAREFNAGLSIRQAVGREGVALARQLESMALVYQVEGDEETGRRAVALFRSVAQGIDPVKFYRQVDSDFFATEHWPKAFAFAWDWLFPLLPEVDRPELAANLERWCAALFEHTESWWWRDASYNCGAIPVGAQGMLMAAIQAEARHPDFPRWFDTCFRKIRENYFPMTWRSSGICNEGPGYAHYHKNPTQFAEAVRRTGGPDIIPESGAVNAMHYLRCQWMPQGGCAPVGDNTGYNRRVFQAIYLHGIRETGDQAGLWTFERYTDLERINPLLVFVFYPDHLKPASPGALKARTSFYFEIDRHRAGYVFSRGRWDDERAPFFVFTTRYADANHTHYDMNSFLFGAFGELFAAHANIFPYGHEHHGVDFEHNIVIIDSGGMPAADRRNSAGDDGSLLGLMTGAGLGHFGDYVRGDARASYADRSAPSTTPAERADRAMLFVKQGPNPYIVVADDIQKDQAVHDYHWQWYTQTLRVAGAGSLGEPFVLDGERSRCRIAFLTPEAPASEFKVVRGGHPPGAVELGLLRVRQRTVRARFLAVAAASLDGAPEPVFRRGPAIPHSPHAASIEVQGDGFTDWIVWQPEDAPGRSGRRIAAGRLTTDGLMAVVRTGPGGQVTGYILGDGSHLEFDGRVLARSERPFSVSADVHRSVATGARRAREGRPPLPPSGAFWLPAQDCEVWANEERVQLTPGPDGTVQI